jgi:two-component system, NtrC family, sensor kinase
MPVVIHRYLWLKLVISLAVSLCLVLAYFGYHILEHLRVNLESATMEAAERVSDSIKKSILYSMQRNDRDQIYYTIKIIGQEPGINKVRIFNEVGRISYSSDDTEIDTFVDKRAEACFACHKEEEPLSRLARPDRLRIYRDQEGTRILGVINAIENEPRCYNAACHAHPPEQQVLGVLDVTMSLEKADQDIQEARMLVLGELALSLASVCLVLGGLVWLLVHKPVHALIVGTEKLAAGDLDYRIPVKSVDEMGRLGNSFNRMTAQLQQARGELTNWARTLEARVDDKTEELRKAHERMLQVERMASMGKLAAIVAHEINNPLAGILTSAKLVLRRLGRIPECDEDTREHVQMIGDEASRCGEIVKNLLQFSRARSDTQQLEDLNRLVEDSVRLVRHKMNLLSLEVQLELDPELPRVNCDGQAIRQMMVAMLINACEAMGDHAGSIHLYTDYDRSAGIAAIRIRDDGCGMDEETRRRIFEPFFTTKDAVKGVGLGLAVVSGIVTAHGGEITVESTLGAGTTFTIRLPVQGAPKPTEQDESRGEPDHA